MWSGRTPAFHHVTRLRDRYIRPIAGFDSSGTLSALYRAHNNVVKNPGLGDLALSGLNRPEIIVLP